MKICNDCHKTKKLTEFTPRKERVGQYTPSCKDCRRKKANKYRRENHNNVRAIEKKYRAKHKIKINHANKLRLRNKRKNDPNFDRAYKLKYTYGITLEDFNEMLKKQKGKCAICGTKEPRGRGFCVDHCHNTGKIRGILCHGCNTGIGSLRDSTELLRKAINYLKT